MTDFVDDVEMFDLRIFLEEVDNTDEDVTEWEADFISTLMDWEGCFTTRQAETLTKMHEKYIG